MLTCSAIRRLVATAGSFQQSQTVIRSAISGEDALAILATLHPSTPVSICRSLAEAVMRDSNTAWFWRQQCELAETALRLTHDSVWLSDDAMRVRLEEFAIHLHLRRHLNLSTEEESLFAIAFGFMTREQAATDFGRSDVMCLVGRLLLAMERAVSMSVAQQGQDENQLQLLRTGTHD